jgi:hypothetical protein
MMIGWNVANARRLREALTGVTDRDKAIDIIRTWWQAPEQGQPRKQDATVADAATATLAFAASFPEHRQHVIEKAAASPQSWGGLRAWAQSEAAEGHAIAPEVANVLLKDRPKARRPKGQKPAQFARDSQLAAIVGALITTPFNSLESAGRGANSAFHLANEATRQSFDMIRHAWRAHKDIFGANN